jgi:drug/metabolite transporter (DMT)-like permease
LAALAYNGALATGFALWAWLSLNRAMPAITSAMGALGVPVVGLLASAVWLGEAINATSAAGLVLISIGLALIMIDTLRRPARRPA